MSHRSAGNLRKTSKPSARAPRNNSFLERPARWVETPWKFALNCFWSILSILTIGIPCGYLFLLIWAEQFGLERNVLGKDANILRALIGSYIIGGMSAAT